MKFSPSEICEMFNIAKSTLFRWEQDGRISVAPRKLNGEREYGQTQIKELANIKLETLSQEFERASASEDLERMQQIMPEISRLKALYLEDVSGLRELAEYESIPENVVRELLLKAANLDSNERLFLEIIELLHLKAHEVAT